MLQCINKQKQLVLGAISYAFDNQDWLPAATAGGKYYREFIAEYVPIPPGESRYTVYCPAVPKTEVVRIGWSRYFGFYNSSTGLPVTSNWIYRRMAKIKRPSEIAISSDSLQWVFDCSCKLYYPGIATVSSVTFPHLNNFAIMSFVDGHAGKVEYFDFEKNSEKMVFNIYK